MRTKLFEIGGRNQIEKGMLGCFGHIKRINESRIEKNICRANLGGNIEGVRQKTFLKQVKNVLKKMEFVVNRITRICMIILIDVSEARDVFQSHARRQSIVSAYFNLNPKA